MTIVWTVIIGFVIGLIARALMPGRDSAGILVTTVLGIAGAAVGSLASQALGLATAGTFPGLIMAVLGAVLLLVIYRLFAPTAAAGKA
jgi:uncharacterized membrane protein YeaQ/YmgE (transglycosylase-associated protein family)